MAGAAYRLAVILCLCSCAILAACSRGEESARPAETPAPTAAAATPTVPGIARPPVTSTIGAGTATARTRAEAFLRRVALTDADVPAGGDDRPPVFGDGPSFAPNPPGPSFSYETAFTWTGGAPVAGGTVLAARHTGFAFPDAATAQANIAAIGMTLTAVSGDRLFAPGNDPRVERVQDLSLGDETIAWRTSGPRAGAAGVEAVRWAIAVRRGAAGSLLIVEGTGGATDTLARDLARRLDQRMAGALPAAWP